MSRLNIALNAGDTIAAVPALLGFYPENNSLVLFLMKPAPAGQTAKLDTILRADLDLRARHRNDRARDAAALCAQRDAATVIALLLDASAALPALSTTTTRTSAHRRFIKALDRALRVHNIELTGAFATTAIRHRAPWWAVDAANSDQVGLVSDPDSSPLAAHSVAEGRTIHRTRTQLYAPFAPDTALQTHVAAALSATNDNATMQTGTAPDIEAHRRNAIAAVTAHIRSAASGVPLNPLELAQITIAIRDYEIRDELLRILDTEHTDKGRDTWALLTRSLTGTDRAQAATIYAYFAYIDGDGPLARAALETALDADPHHTLATLLTSALNAAVRPEQVRAAINRRR
ncbi:MULTISPECIES: DUF4192 domain-containing protein [Nocardia]|uniref:DUF4192 domain-containing protein n=1 Tax=Nocardia TaxID=1817 RepID=UPI002454608E|nr:MULTISPECIES: DUF4192 domain-containing protein [Nocardia]